MLRIAAILALVAVGTYGYENIANPVEATGQVIAKQHQSSGGGKGDSYRFIVRYQVDNADYSFSFSRPFYEAFREYSIGSDVAIRYDRNDPAHATLTRWDYAHPITMVFLALLLIELGVLFWFTCTPSGRNRAASIRHKNEK